MLNIAVLTVLIAQRLLDGGHLSKGREAGGWGGIDGHVHREDGVG